MEKCVFNGRKVFPKGTFRKDNQLFVKITFYNFDNEETYAFPVVEDQEKEILKVMQSKKARKGFKLKLKWLAI